ncbi:hypothetical protein D3Z51_11755 [Clostridiaceae bacterium]|nr:hypothetical protein [Clostridiaceae bacterium]RKI12931.1 hypothetical protein D7V81_11285 [bacterium 1XD21-70]
MNTKKTLKNSILSCGAQIATLFLQLLNRRIFVMFLDIEFLGYHSLFTNIFLLLSVAEAGIGNIVSFHLYKEINENNKEEIGKLMCLYKWLYRLIAAVVFFMGCGCYFLLPYFVGDISVSWEFLRLIYFLQLGGVVVGYLVSYRRTIYIVTQQEYRCMRVDLYTLIIIQTIQLITLYIHRNYIIYLILQLCITIVSNFIIAIRAGEEYPYLRKKYLIRWEDIKKRNLVSDAGNFIIHKISYAVYGGTDSIVISAFCGIKNVALHGSYITIQSGVNKIINRFMNPLQAAIGTIVHGNRSKKELWEQFEVLDILSFFLASYLSLGFFVFFQPVIQIWLGKQYLLSEGFVIAFSINYYFVIVWEIVYRYRAVFGGYRKDRKYMIYSAILNLAVSVFLARRIGVIGVQIGTIIGYLSIAYGRIKFVIRDYFNKPLTSYLVKHSVLFITTVIEAIICYEITHDLQIDFWGLAGRAVAWMLVPLIINVLINLRNPYFKQFIEYVKKATYIILGKFIALKH